MPPEPLASPLVVRPRAPEHDAAVTALLAERWLADFVVVHDTVYVPRELPGFVALAGEQLVGLVTYALHDGGCEIVTLDSTREGAGVGTSLLDAVLPIARADGSVRMWLVTTNDNVDALRFYQKRGFRIVAVHRGAADRARARKPAIPALGAHGIPVHDELELELPLEPVHTPREDLSLE